MSATSLIAADITV